MMDDTPNEIFPVTDNVTGFSVSQLFDALQPDVTSMQQYRARLDFNFGSGLLLLSSTQN